MHPGCWLADGSLAQFTLTAHDEEGNRRKVERTTVKHKTKVKKFYYKFEVMGTKVALEVEKNSHGGSFFRAGLET